MFLTNQPNNDITDKLKEDMDKVAKNQELYPQYRPIIRHEIHEVYKYNLPHYLRKAYKHIRLRIGETYRNNTFPK